MKYNIDAVQAVNFYSLIKDIDPISFSNESDRQQLVDAKSYFVVLIKQCNYIKMITGFYPVSIELDLNILTWIMDKVNDASKCKIMY